jgi:hypothetical protein
MKEQDAMGLIVMVSPVLWTSGYAGSIGRIEFTDFTADDIWIRFDDEEVDCFSSKTVFVLKNADELNELAENKQAWLWPPLPENLKILAALQAFGSDKQMIAAFKLLQDDPELHRSATIRLNEAIDLASQRKTGR